MKKLLDWNDDKGMLALVEDEFLEQARQDTLDERHRNYPGPTYAEFYRSIEREAIEAAKAGNFRPLVEMRRGENPLVRRMQDKMGCQLSAEAEKLIDQRLLGEPRVKKGRGVAKRSLIEREASPTFNAAQDVPYIEEILREHFSGRRNYRVRAIELAAQRAGIVTDTLVNFIRKGRDK